MATRRDLLTSKYLSFHLHSSMHLNAQVYEDQSEALVLSVIKEGSYSRRLSLVAEFTPQSGGGCDMPDKSRFSVTGGFQTDRDKTWMVESDRFKVVTSSVAPVTDTGQGTTPSVGTERPHQPPDDQVVHRDGPRVDMAHSGNVSSVQGRTASLRCRVLQRANKTVSWIRHRDLHLLTVDQYTYTTDQRFQSVQLRDQGIYECQIGTTPPKSHFVTLHIIEPRTEILGGGDVHVNTGSTINLTCLVLYHARSPHTLTWLHQGKIAGTSHSQEPIRIKLRLNLDYISFIKKPVYQLSSLPVTSVLKIEVKFEVKIEVKMCINFEIKILYEAKCQEAAM
ncbi:Limbic system-associated membrane protein-like 1, partial [Homarus americanus]